MVTNLTEGHQLAHAGKPDMKKLSDFSFLITSTGFVYDK
jgi:hypothetical protein